MRLLAPVPRRVLLTVLPAVVVAGGLVGFAPTAASAAYSTVVVDRGARLQACRATVDGDRVLRFRLDNRAGRRTRTGAVLRDRSGRSRTFRARAAAGDVSGIRTVRTERGDRLVGAVLTDGSGLGLSFRRAELRVC